MRVRVGLRAPAKVPFADMYSVIALVLQHFGDRHFRSRQAHLRKRHGIIGCVAVIIDRRQRAAIHVIGKHRNNPPHAGWCGRELKTRARRIAPGHQHCARRRTGAIARIGLREQRALGGKPVDIRRRHAATGHPATKCAEIIDAQIIHQDEHHVGRAVRCRRSGNLRSLVPVNRDMFCHVYPSAMRRHIQDDRLAIQDSGNPCCKQYDDQANRPFLPHVPHLPGFR